MAKKGHFKNKINYLILLKFIPCKGLVNIFKYFFLEIIILIVVFILVEILSTIGIITPVQAPLSSPLYQNAEQQFSNLDQSQINQKPKKISTALRNAQNFCRSDTYATTFCRQLSLLMMRTFLILWRDRSLTAMRLLIHFSIATLIGTMYWGIGNDAANVFNNFRYIFFSIMFLMFTAFSAMTLVCEYHIKTIGI